MPIDATIRQARTGDAAVIADFNLRLAAETEQRELDRERVLQGVHAVLSHSGKGTYYVAESEGAIVGQLLITFEWSDWRNGNFWWIQSVYVREDFRARGVFRSLFEHVQRLAKAQPGVCGLRLYMDAQNDRARKTYERLGLRHTAYEVFEKDFVLHVKGDVGSP